MISICAMIYVVSGIFNIILLVSSIAKSKKIYVWHLLWIIASMIPIISTMLSLFTLLYKCDEELIDFNETKDE